MSNKDIGIIPSLNCLPNQPGQICALPDDFGALRVFNHLGTVWAIQANNKAWTQDQSSIGELMHIKGDPHLTLQPVGLAWMQLNGTLGGRLSPQVSEIAPTSNTTHSVMCGDIMHYQKQRSKIAAFFS